MFPRCDYNSFSSAVDSNFEAELFSLGADCFYFCPALLNFLPWGTTARWKAENIMISKKWICVGVTPFCPHEKFFFTGRNTVF
jgi:hypothetical protein